MESKFFMGCDISKESFNYCLRSEAGIALEGVVENASKPIKSWIHQLKKHHALPLGEVIFCLEHTGVYGAILLRELSRHSLLICVENAVNIKLSLGMQRGKNDRIDARRIAEYAMRFIDKLKQWQPRREVLIQLQLLNRLRERLINAKTDLTRFNQDAIRFLTKQESRIVIEGIKKPVDAIFTQIKQTERQIESLIQGDEHLKQLKELITSVDGVGIVTCCAIIVKTNEFKDLREAKKFACTAGIAPFEHTSGKSVRGKPRVSHHAHKDLKTLLHMGAVSVIGRKGSLQDYYLRKVSQGKNKMLVINAVRNKLVSRVFAVVRDGVMYDKNYQYRLEMS
jgi:transposase